MIIEFKVPAMSADVYTSVGGKRKKKVDGFGHVVTTERVFAKERPRFSKGHVFSSQRTSDFESHIRRHFFDKYPSDAGVVRNGKIAQVSKMFLGCWKLGEPDCTSFRTGIEGCKKCPYRRRNLCADIKVYQKDARALDLDNVLKIVLDALNGVCYYDDSQFIRKHIEGFFYSEEEYLEVCLSVQPEFVKEGVVLGAYDLSKLSITEAEKYLASLCKTVRDDVPYKNVLLAWAKRCDSRKYIQKIEQELLKNDKNFM